MKDQLILHSEIQTEQVLSLSQIYIIDYILYISVICYPLSLIINNIHSMLNKNHVAEIRTCQRVKFDQALYILTMYQKKIRSQIQFPDDEPIDAQKQYDQKIIRSWNGKWKVDLTKPVLNCVTSVSPRVIMDFNENQPAQMCEQNEYDEYNQIMLQFIRRMRAQHEDESNFKITQVNINEIDDNNNNKFSQFAVKACKHYFSAIENICEGMKNSIQKNSNSFQLEQQDQQDNYCLEIGSRIQDILEVLKNTQQNYLNDDLLKFITSCVIAFDNIKQSEHGSTVVTVQPKLSEFTYILHPLFLPYYSFLLRQKDELKSKMQHRENNRENNRSNPDNGSRENEENKFPFKHFFASNTTNQSKVVFINLDGYQSEFNLQFARCFRKNMLYISFPKEDIHSANDMNSIYEQRLYKKIMYNWEKNKMKWDANASNNSNMDYESLNADRLYYMTHNIQNYFNTVEGVLYRSQNNFDDLNRNMYMFPLRLNTLNENFNNLIPQDEDDTIEVYESHAILHIFKYFLINQIKQFGPTFIVISHSGRLNIQDSHFVQIIQELTKISHYKLVYFPNLTARLCSKDKRGIDHELNIQNIDYLHRAPHESSRQANSKPKQAHLSYQFFNKLARFLKVSSGTHNLMKNFEEEDLLTKYRNFNILRKVNRLMEVLGNQYDNIQKIRFKSSQIDIIPKLYEKDTEKIIKAFEKLVPLFYIELYQLVQSIISVCILPQQKKPFMELSKYNIDPQTIRQNHIIAQLISYIKNKIIVRNVYNENERQQLLFAKIKKYLNCQKDKHFLEISEQKYQDSILLHFKMAENSQIFQNVPEGKPYLVGLIDVSFSNPYKDIKDCMHIFDSTQILYKLNQYRGKGNIPILIMNHLPLEKKTTSKFDNYCAFLNREVLQKLSTYKTSEQGVEKIYEQKKIKPYPIKFFDEENREIIQPRFEFRTEWNYCQTDEYMILYWPLLFNFVQAISYKLQGKTYEPTIMNQFFIAKKEVKNDAVCFYKANVPDDIAPRTGCSAYEFKNFLYIFGGFYAKSENYLSLQRDVTLANLGLYTHEGHRKLQMSNLKNQLYESITIENDNDKKPNSYVRPRRQYEFFEMDDISNDYQSEIGFHEVIMIGGVGQNFIHPYSLLTYYYYILKFEQESGKLVSIKKQLVYNKSIPVNIRRPSKNMGIIKTPIRNKNQANGKSISIKPQLTQPSSYARFRVIYKMQKGDLKYKFQYIFSEKDCKLLKQELRKYQDDKYQVNELSNIRIQKIEGMNHMFMFEKYGAKQIVHLRLQVEGIKDRRQQQYKLTHDSISYLNIINGNYISAIVKHPIFTNDRSLLVQCKVKNVQNQNLNEDEAPYVTLKPIHSDLKGDLTLHIIQASNINLIYILHGHRLYNSPKLYQYQITHNRKSGMKSVLQIKPKKPISYLSDKSIPKYCYSTFFYKKVQIKNQIICQNYLTFEEQKNTIIRIDEYFDPSDFNNMCWLFKQPIIKYRLYLNNSNTAISLERIIFLDFYKRDQLRIIIVQYNRKKYLIKITDNLNKLQTGEYIILMQPVTQFFIRSLDQQQFERGSILIKNSQQYIDRGYDKVQEVII